MSTLEGSQPQSRKKKSLKVPTAGGRAHNRRLLKSVVSKSGNPYQVGVSLNIKANHGGPRKGKKQHPEKSITEQGEGESFGRIARRAPESTSPPSSQPKARPSGRNTSHKQKKKSNQEGKRGRDLHQNPIKQAHNASQKEKKQNKSPKPILHNGGTKDITSLGIPAVRQTNLHRTRKSVTIEKRKRRSRQGRGNASPF